MLIGFTIVAAPLLFAIVNAAVQMNHLSARSEELVASLVRFGARWVLRTDPELALSGRYVVSKRLQDEGFAFQFPHLSGALADLLMQTQPSPSPEPVARHDFRDESPRTGSVDGSLQRLG